MRARSSQICVAPTFSVSAYFVVDVLIELLVSSVCRQSPIVYQQKDARRDVNQFNFSSFYFRVEVLMRLQKSRKAKENVFDRD